MKDGADESLSAEFIAQVTRHQRRLYAFILTMLGSPTDADDVLQETNLVLWRKSAEFTPGTDFVAWAFRVAQLQVMAFRKSRQRKREYFDEDLIRQLIDEAQAQAAQADRRHDALRHCLEQLPPRQRALVARRYEPGGSVNDIARETGRSPKAVSEALRRVREALLQCIEQRLAREGE